MKHKKKKDKKQSDRLALEELSDGVQGESREYKSQNIGTNLGSLLKDLKK